MKNTRKVSSILTDPGACLVTALRLAGPIFIAVFFTACTSKGPLELSDDAPPNPRDVSEIPNAVPKAEPLSRYGNPVSYVVYGKRYYTLPSSKGYKERGLASWYGTKFHGKRTSSGEPYDLYGMTAAHKTLPLPTYVEVTNLNNDRSVIVKVNDRGPFHGDRLIDLSYTAAVKLGIVGNGTGEVEVESIDTATLTTDSATGSATGTAAVVAAAAAPGPVSRPDDALLYLQAGAFSNRENAERLQEKIRSENIGAVRIVENTVDNTTFYKVQVGPLANDAAVDQTTRALETLGINESRPIVE